MSVQSTQQSHSGPLDNPHDTVSVVKACSSAKWHTCSGIVPSSRLKWRAIFSAFSRLPISVGIVPVNSLLNRYKISSERKWLKMNWDFQYQAEQVRYQARFRQSWLTQIRQRTKLRRNGSSKAHTWNHERVYMENVSSVCTAWWRKVEHDEHVPRFVNCTIVFGRRLLLNLLKPKISDSVKE